MPLGQRETFADITAAWHKAERETDKRAVWRALARGGWFRACREAVQGGDRATIETWLDASSAVKQEILRYPGEETAQIVRTHFWCSLAACRAQGLALWEPFDAASEEEAVVNAPLGFCRDLTRALLGDPLRAAERDISLPVVLVDTARNEGVVAALTLELLPNGRGEFYPVPDLVFVRDADFRRAEDGACACVKSAGVWQEGWDARWRLHRRDGRPIASLTGPSLGAAFALGMGKLFAGE